MVSVIWSYISSFVWRQHRYAYATSACQNDLECHNCWRKTRLHEAQQNWCPHTEKVSQPFIPLTPVADMPTLITNSSSIKMLKLSAKDKQLLLNISVMKLVKANTAFNGNNIDKLTEIVMFPSWNLVPVSCQLPIGGLQNNYITTKNRREVTGRLPTKILPFFLFSKIVSLITKDARLPIDKSLVT